MKRRGKNTNKSAKKKSPSRNLPIIHEDRDLIVLDKVCGLLTMGNEKERDKTAIAYLNDYVRKGVVKSSKQVFIVHRLDRDTSGVLVVAKDVEGKGYLQKEWSTFQKTYYAVVHGTLEEKEGVLTSYLTECGVHKVYSVKDESKGKLAKTSYKVIKENSDFSLVEIDLLTGRKHQIRVQFADIGHPVVGDKKYDPEAKSFKRLALHAGSMTINHPYSKERVTYEAKMPSYMDSLMKRA